MVIILSGGVSKRMGRAKALLPLSAENPTTFLEAIVRKTAGYGKQLVVSSLDPEKLKTNLKVVEQPHPELGQLHSVQLAWRSMVCLPNWALICPVDHPYFRPQTLTDLFAARMEHPDYWLWTPSCQKKGGHPVLFSRAFMEVLNQAPTELGARPVVKSHLNRRYFLETTDERILWDVDTPEEYQMYAKLYQSSRQET